MAWNDPKPACPSGTFPKIAGDYFVDDQGFGHVTPPEEWYWTCSGDCAPGTEYSPLLRKCVPSSLRWALEAARPGENVSIYGDRVSVVRSADLPGTRMSRDRQGGLGSYFADVVGAAITGASNIGAFVANPALFTATKIAEFNDIRTEVNGMSLNIGGILQGVSGVIGGVQSGNYWNVLSGGLNTASHFFPQPAAQPVSYPSPAIYSGGGQPMTVAAGGAAAIGAAAGHAAIAALRPIFIKIATKLGLRTMPSLNKAMSYVRSLGKAQLAPAAIAAALGITVDELARLIVTDKHRKRRRMNPANVHALRRSMRRIKSFHRLCVTADTLRSRGRRACAPTYAFQRRKKCK